MNLSEERQIDLEEKIASVLFDCSTFRDEEESGQAARDILHLLCLELGITRLPPPDTSTGLYKQAIKDAAGGINLALQMLTNKRRSELWGASVDLAEAALETFLVNNPQEDKE